MSHRIYLFISSYVCIDLSVNKVSVLFCSVAGSERLYLKWAWGKIATNSAVTCQHECNIESPTQQCSLHFIYIHRMRMQMLTCTYPGVSYKPPEQQCVSMKLYGENNSLLPYLECSSWLPAQQKQRDRIVIFVLFGLSMLFLSKA